MMDILGTRQVGARRFAIAGILAVALVLLPTTVARWLTGTQLTVAALPGTVAAGFEQWVRSGRASSEPLSQAVRYWEVFHVVKTIVAVALVSVVVPLVRQVWGAYARAQSIRRRTATWLVGASGALAVPVLVLVVMANVQGAVAPLSSVLNFLPMDGPAVAQVREDLATGRATPPLATLVDDFRLYHAALVVAAVAAIVAAGVTTATLWMRRARIDPSERRLRRVLASGGMIVPVMLLFLGVVLLANVSSVADTRPALAAFFDGSAT
jgi:hypothetical protein